MNKKKFKDLIISEYKRDFYKNLLFSQHEESNLLNKNKYGTEDILILKQILFINNNNT